jgi:dUTP pyrophosphatase
MDMAGVCDEGYRGEVHMQICNLSSKEHTFKKGDKIGQIICLPVVYAELVEADELEDSDRGANGFGSSGQRKK